MSTSVLADALDSQLVASCFVGMLFWAGEPSHAAESSSSPPPLQKTVTSPLRTLGEALGGQGQGTPAAYLDAGGRGPDKFAETRDRLLAYGRKGGDLGKRALEADDAFFAQGQPWLGDVYYKTDIGPMLDYLRIKHRLTPAERRVIEDGIRASARFRMRAMDRWNHTPNLVLKPTYMVAVAGLAIDDPELIEWGLHREMKAGRGGYLAMVEKMVRPSGPWNEAPIYPISHDSLLSMTRMSRLLRERDGEDWFARPIGEGGSPKALMEYFIHTAYPAERTGLGRGQIRVATYGDGATGPGGDLFLANPAGPAIDMHEELAEAFAASGDPAYAAFLDWAADASRPLSGLPAAPSTVWPEFGFAMLRSDETAGYWTNEEAIAVTQVMSQGYGHDHRDKFGITMFGGGRLLYPDYNAVQYENPAFGWTRNTLAHNSVTVDEQDTRDRPPSAIRQQFGSHAKFLATSASGVFTGVDQTRALLLTDGYLLDLFHLKSAVPHDYDYLLHSFGRPEPMRAGSYRASDRSRRRYWQLEEARAARFDDGWQFDFVLDTEQQRRLDRAAMEAMRIRSRPKKFERFKERYRFGDAWYEHKAGVRVTMVGEADTQVTLGRGPHDLGMLVARREARPETAFVVVHEPYSGEKSPEIRAVELLARSASAFLVRIEGEDHIDYAAVSTDPRADGRPQMLRDGESGIEVAFRSYGWLRIHADGSAVAEGDWVGFRLPETIHSLAIGGEERKVKRLIEERKGTLFDDLSTEPDPIWKAAAKNPLVIEYLRGLPRLFEGETRRETIVLHNISDHPIAGEVHFDNRSGVEIEPSVLPFGPLQAEGSAKYAVTLTTTGASVGPHEVAYRVASSGDGENASGELSAALALEAMVGPVLEKVYRYPDPAVYRVHAPRLTVEIDMYDGGVRKLVDDAGQVRFDDQLLFEISDEKGALLSKDKGQAFTWAHEAPADVVSELEHRMRFQTSFVGDRMMWRTDRDWTQAKSVEYRLPDQWKSSATRPDWAAFDPPGAGLRKGGHRRLAAAELTFADGGDNLCFQFLPPQDVELEGAGMRFSVESQADARWTMGFCRPGTLLEWQWDQAN